MVESGHIDLHKLEPGFADEQIVIGIFEPFFAFNTAQVKVNAFASGFGGGVRFQRVSD